MLKGIMILKNTLILGVFAFFALVLVTPNTTLDNILSKSIIPDVHGTTDNENNTITKNKLDGISESNDMDKKLAVITFDDGKKGQIINAKPILDENNFTATFSVICNNVSKSDHLNWNEIQQLEKDGHDIASHSMNHTELEDITMEVAKYEIIQSKKCLLDNGIKQVGIFTYPKNGGSDNQLILQEVSKHYDMARTGNDPLAFLQCNLEDLQTTTIKVTCPALAVNENFGRYTVVGWSHDADREGEGYNDEQMLQRFIEVVESQSEYNKGNEIKAIPILIYHDIDTKSGFYTTSTELFEAEMKYLKDNGFTIIRLLDLI